MSQKYEPKFKRKMVRLHLEERRTYKSITTEYGISKTAIQRWYDECNKKCQSISQTDPTAVNEAQNITADPAIRTLRKESIHSCCQNKY